MRVQMNIDGEINVDEGINEGINEVEALILAFLEKKARC